MKRLWVFFAVVAMLVQWTYAAAGNYCSHEADSPVAAMHWGHHVHTHGAGASEEHDSAPGQPAGFDLDCGFCHAASSAVTGAPVAVVTAAAQALARALDPPRFQSRAPDLPERPNWAVLSHA